MNKLKLLLVSTILICSNTFALPDDKEQRVDVSSDSSELFLDENKVIHYGTEENPVVINQGSMRIEGQEVTIINENGEPKTITAIGNPARFQQQPEVDKAIIYGKGDKIFFDNTIQFLTMNEDAELIQEGNILRGFHVEYDMVAQKARANSNGNEEDRVNMVIQPENGNQ